ncbi:MAG: DUF1453 domain-containing protein [Acidobacteria bacterium]|nr:DUF1453 domain-containing protein [Acidobacteriota bacterium]
MPLIVLPVLMLVMLAVIALIPVSLVQRYRVGTARRLARGWVTTINLIAIALSTGLFLLGAAITSAWVPEAFRYALTGFAGGCVLGLLGLSLSRWEVTPRGLHYTPNRWLVLAITLVVTARVMYGFWRGWQAWRYTMDGSSWLIASGVPGSLAAGAIVLGYYLMYWFGVRRRFVRHRSSGR